VEGARADSGGERIQVELAREMNLDGFVVWPGYMKSARAFQENALPGALLLAPEGEPEQTYALYYRLEAARGQGAEAACARVSGDAVNLAPRLVVFPRLLRTARLSLAFPYPASGHRPRYDDMALSEWQPLLSPVEGEEAPGDAELPQLKGPLASAHAFLARFQRSGSPEVAPDAQLPDLLQTSLPPGLPAWAAAALKERLTARKVEAGQPPHTQLARAFLGQFINQAVAVQALPDGKVRLLGAPLVLAPPAAERGKGEREVVLFPELLVDAERRLSAAALRHGGRTGRHCQGSLPL
jgi:hypothetical protein